MRLRSGRSWVVATVLITSIGLVAPPTGGSSVSAASALDQFKAPYVEIDIVPQDLADHPSSGLLYASVEPTSPTYADSVVAVDPDTGSIVASWPVGGAPGEMTFTPDGSALYLSRDAAHTVTKNALPAMTEEWSFDLGTQQGPLGAPYFATSIALMPGTTDTIAIARNTDRVQGFGDVLVVDDGVARPTITGQAQGEPRYDLDWITFADDPTVLYATSESGGTRRVDIDADGAHADDEVLDLSGQPTYHDGLLYGLDVALDVTTDPPTVAWTAEVPEFARWGAINATTNSLFVGWDNLMSAEGRDFFTEFDIASRTPVREWLAPVELQPTRTPLTFGDEWLAYRGGAAGTLFLLDVSDPVNLGGLGEYTALTPARVLDTRTGLGLTGGVGRRLGGGETITVDVTGVGGVPSEGVDTIVMNVAAVDPSAAGFLTVYPAGITAPLISNVNFTPGQTVSNLVTVPVDDQGRVSVFTPAGAVDVLFDVAGFYARVDGPRGGRFRAFAEPIRLLDTRGGANGRYGPLAAQQTWPLEVPDFGSMVAVALNVTVTEPTAPSFVTVWPDDVSQPTVSNLNFSTGRTLANQVIVRVPANRVLQIFNAAGSAQVVVDMVGFYTDERRFDDGRFVSFEPFRAFDTRVDSPFPPPGDLWSEDVMFWGRPDETLDAFVINVTVTDTREFGYVAAFPYTDDDTRLPLTSTLNYAEGQTVPNHAISAARPYVGFLNSGGKVHLIVDVFGAFT